MPTVSPSSVPVMFEDTLTLCTGSSLPAPLTARVIDVRVAVAGCTVVIRARRGCRLFMATRPTRAMITTAKIQRPMVIVLSSWRRFHATHDETRHEEIQREADRDRSGGLGPPDIRGGTQPDCENDDRPPGEDIDTG